MNQFRECLTAVVVVSSMIGLAGCSLTGSATSEPVVETVNVFDSDIGGAVLTEGAIWVTSSRNYSTGESHLEIVRLDAATGKTESTTDLGPGSFIRGLGYHNGQLIVRRRGLTSGVPTVSLLSGYIQPEDEPDALLTIEVPSLQVSQQFELPPLRGYEPLTVIDGDVWFHGSSVLGTIDLDSGEANIRSAYSFSPREVRQVYQNDGSLWVVNPRDITGYDLMTSDTVVGYTDEALRSGFKYYNGAYWVIGEELDQLDTAYEYDVETGALSNPTPVDDLPARAFVDGDYRWDLYRSDTWHLDPTDEPEPEDVWHQVDPTTGETLARYRFGEYTPRFATPGYLWLTRPVGDDSQVELGRIPLPEHN